MTTITNNTLKKNYLYNYIKKQNKEFNLNTCDICKHNNMFISIYWKNTDSIIFIKRSVRMTQHPSIRQTWSHLSSVWQEEPELTCSQSYQWISLQEWWYQVLGVNRKSIIPIRPLYVIYTGGKMEEDNEDQRISFPSNNNLMNSS